MNRIRLCRWIVSLAIAAGLAPLAIADEAATSLDLERVRSSPLQLRRFVEALPKGGDLHNHLSGAVYAETFLGLAAADQLCLDTTTFALKSAPCGDKGVPAANALENPTLYQQALDAMSMRQFRPATESGHDHFFATFGKFSAVSGRHVPEMLTEVVSRFARENVDYVETIFAPDRGAAGAAGARLPDGLTIAQMYEALTTTYKADVDKALQTSRATIDDAEAKMKGALGCGTAAPQPGCDSVVRYIFEVHRGRPRQQVFAEMVVGFMAATSDPRIVAVNPVMAEDWYVPMRDFHQHMEMLAFLRGLYPTVPVTAHAGELAPGLVPPEALRTHVSESVRIANAQRIGHGVDILRESDAESTLRLMAARPVAVEICLTSNDVILGVRGKAHPMRAYLEHDVPLVLATDDPGVSRGDLSTEFQRAVEEQGLSWVEMKRIVRNSLQWSFLQGKSVWTSGAYTAFVEPCATDVPGHPLSAQCRDYLAREPKAAQQWRLEQRLAAFEGQSH